MRPSRRGFVLDQAKNRPTGTMKVKERPDLSESNQKRRLMRPALHHLPELLGGVGMGEREIGGRHIQEAT